MLNELRNSDQKNSQSELPSPKETRHMPQRQSQPKAQHSHRAEPDKSENDWEHLLETWRSLQSSATIHQNSTGNYNQNESHIAESLSYLHTQVDLLVKRQMKEQADYEAELEKVKAELTTALN